MISRLPFILGLLLTDLAVAGSIKVSQVSDLRFGVAPQGAAAVTIPAGTSETASNASFRVTGNANQSFTIAIPTGNIQMEGPLPKKLNQIDVHSFSSFPSGTGVLDPSGAAMVYVGATRTALAVNLPPGSYDGAFSLTVVY